ncbi:unnamed protein product [Candidula unifasciata]|uniref:Ribosome-recycling factor, mitochondrial n=1 Tax=Candidula unifasciata TaxID=100452 RepID=A0A8S3ZYQ2_9EUPU|nr:unnamed protein product [Candidula unifasciata]
MALNCRPYSFLWGCVKVQRQINLLTRSCCHHMACNRSPLPQMSVRQLHVLPCGTSRPVLTSHTPALSVYRLYAKKGKEKGGKGHKKMILSPEQLSGLVDMDAVNEEFTRVLEDLKDRFIHQLSVRTSQGVFDNLVIKTPDGNFPLIQLGQVIQKSAQMLAINMTPSPQYITHVKTALEESGLNINPQQDGTSLFIALPKITKEHRENLAKNAKMLSEKSKKHLRDIYSKYSKQIRSSKEGHPADVVQAADDMVQDLMHDMIHKVEEMTAAKQQELLGGK